MTIDLIQKRKIQKYLILVLAVVILITLNIYWWFYLREPVLPSVKPLKLAPKIEVNLDLLKSPFVQELEPFEGIKPFTDKIGRENPFLMFK